MLVSRGRTLSLVLLTAGCVDGRSQQPEEVTIAEQEPEPPRDDPPDIVELPSVELEATFELHECGAIMDLVPLEGRVFGVTNAASGGPTACAFDLDERGEDLRFDRLRIDDDLFDGVAAQLVEAGGVQTIAARWRGGSPERTQLGLFERTRSGVTAVRSEPARGEWSPGTLGLVRDNMGNPVVAYPSRATIPGCSVEPARTVTESMLWMPLTQGHESASGHFVDRAVASEHGVVVAGSTGPLDEQRCSSLLEVASVGTPGWWSDAGASWDEAKGASALDMIALGDHWLVLAECDYAAWVASLSAHDGEIAWQADVGIAQRGRLVESPDGGVEIVLYVHLRSDRRLLVRRHVSAEGALGPERVVQVALDPEVRIWTLALTGGGRVWLGGVIDATPTNGDHAWLGFVDFA